MVSGQINPGDRHGGDAFFAANKSQAFVGGRLDADLLDVEAERFADAQFHIRNVRKHTRRLCQERGIEIDDGPTAKGDLPGSFLQEHTARRILPPRIRVGKEVADVHLSDGSEDGVANGVHQDVRVGVSQQTRGVRDFDASQNEFSAGSEGVNIVANSNVKHGGRLEA